MSYIWLNINGITTLPFSYLDHQQSSISLYNAWLNIKLNVEIILFQIVNLPFISSNIPAAPAYGVYIPQLVRYSRVCVQYSDFLDRAQLLRQKIIKQGYVVPRLKSSLQTFYCRYRFRNQLESSFFSLPNSLPTMVYDEAFRIVTWQNHTPHYQPLGPEYALVSFVWLDHRYPSPPPSE